MHGLKLNTSLCPAPSLLLYIPLSKDGTATEGAGEDMGTIWLRTVKRVATCARDIYAHVINPSDKVTAPAHVSVYHLHMCPCTAYRGSAYTLCNHITHIASIRQNLSEGPTDTP